MNQKLIPTLQKIFWVIGWSVLVLAVVNVTTEAYMYFFPPVTEAGLELPKREFHFLKSAALLFSSLAQAFFAFLISSIFTMVFKRSPVRQQQTESFLFLTCIGFVGEGVFGLISWAQSVYYILPPSDFSSIWGFLSAGTFVLSLFSKLISFVYAIAIYILYRHFSQMVTFEAEVI